MTSASRRLLPLLALSLSIHGCGDSTSKGQDADLVSYPGLSITLKEGNVSSELKALAADINAGKPVSFKQITTELARIHKTSSLDSNQSSTPEETLKILSEISAGASVADLHAYKTNLETKLGSKLNQDLKYNKAATSVADILKLGKLQCYSASSLFDLSLRQQMSGSAFDAANNVMIYESGHILPGYVKDGQLHGIEMTTKGKAQVKYGTLKDHQFPLRLVDAGYWAVVEIFKFSASNTAEMATKALEATAKKLNVPLTAINRPETSSSPNASTLPTVLNSSPFAFGSPDVPDGDLDRETMNDPIERTQRGHPGRRGGVIVPGPTPGGGGGSQEIIQFVSIEESQYYPEHQEPDILSDLELSLGVPAQSLINCFERQQACDLEVIRAPFQPSYPLSILRFMMEDASSYGTIHLIFSAASQSFYAEGIVSFPGLGQLRTEFLMYRSEDGRLAIDRTYFDSQNRLRAQVRFRQRL